MEDSCFQDELKAQPPCHGSSQAAFVYGGARRGFSLAKVDSVGESTWKPRKTIGYLLH